MKRKLFFLIIVTIFSVLLCSCNTNEGSKNSERETVSIAESDSNSESTSSSTGANNTIMQTTKYEALVYDFSDAVPSASVNKEYNFSDDRYASIVPVASIEKTVGDISFSGTYYTTQYRPYDYFPGYVYRDSDNNELIVDEKGTLVGYTSADGGDTSFDVSEEECVQMAIEFMREILDISPYTITVSKSYSITKVQFTKYINEFKTIDSATILFRSNGTILGYAGHMLGRIPVETDTSNIIITDMRISVEEKLDVIFESSKGIFDDVKYDFENASITLTKLKDDKKAVMYQVNVDCIDYYDGLEEITSERVCFVVYPE